MINALLLCAALPVFAQTPESLAVSAELSAPAVSLRFRGIPPRRRVGTLAGTVNGSEALLRWTQVHHRVTGTVNGKQADTLLDTAADTITGQANGGTVALRYDWRQDGITVQGTVNGVAVRYEIDWKARTVRGEAGGKPIRLDFTMEWDISGELGGKPANLSWDKAQSKLAGTLNGADFRAGFLHVTLSDFLTHLYLLLP